MTERKKNKSKQDLPQKTSEQICLDDYRQEMPYWKRASYSFSKMRGIVMQQNKDGRYVEMTKQFYKETDPKVKKRLAEAREKYWQIKTDLEDELRDYENEKTKIQAKIGHVKHLLDNNVIISKGIPAKHILYCKYPGVEFREEIEASKIEASYEEEYDIYQDWLHDYITDILINLDLKKFVGDYFTEDEIPACGHFWYGEVRTEVFGNGGFPLNENIKIYLDSVREDGTIIDTEEIDIVDYVNLESEKETLMECGFWGETDEYIETSLDKFVEETGWHIGLWKGSERIEDVSQWPAPDKNGRWIDKDGTEMYPCLWYGYNDGRSFTEEEDSVWNIDNGLDFWFSDDPESYIVEYDYDGHAGCYGGGIPDIEAIRKECPILLEEDDTEESIDEKVQAFLLEQYRKAH